MKLKCLINGYAVDCLQYVQVYGSCKTAVATERAIYMYPSKRFGKNIHPTLSDYPALSICICTISALCRNNAINLHTHTHLQGGIFSQHWMNTLSKSSTRVVVCTRLLFCHVFCLLAGIVFGILSCANNKCVRVTHEQHSAYNMKYLCKKYFFPRRRANSTESS